MRRFGHFDLKIRFVRQRRAIFISLLNNYLSAPALARLLFDPPEPRIMEQTQRFATFLTLRVRVSSFLKHSMPDAVVINCELRVNVCACH